MPIDSSWLLQSAVLENNEEAVRFLLKHGANANSRAGDFVKSLFKKVSHRPDTCQYCTRELKEMPFRTRRTFPPNPIVSARGPSSTYRVRNRSQQQQEENKKPITPMHIAAANGHENILKLLICYGGEVDILMDGNYTPLILAVLYENYELVEILLNQGANVNARSGGGKTPMYFAVKTKQLSMVSLLFKNGANPNLATEHGVTPLHIAVEKKSLEITEILLKNGANVNVKTKTGVTPLHCAAVKGQTDITELILQYGADVSVIMNKGEIDVTPLLWVTQIERRKLAELVKKYAPKSKRGGLCSIFFQKIWKQFVLKKF